MDQFKVPKGFVYGILALTCIAYLCTYVGWVALFVNQIPHSYFALLILCILSTIHSILLQEHILQFSHLKIRIAAFLLTLAVGGLLLHEYYIILPENGIPGEWGFFGSSFGAVEQLEQPSFTGLDYQCKFTAWTYFKLTALGLLSTVPMQWMTMDYAAAINHKHVLQRSIIAKRRKKRLSQNRNKNSIPE